MNPLGLYINRTFNSTSFYRAIVLIAAGHPTPPVDHLERMLLPIQATRREPITNEKNQTLAHPTHTTI